MKYIDVALILTMATLIVWPKKEGHSKINITVTDDSIKKLYRQAELSQERLESTIFKEKLREQQLLKHHRNLERKFNLLKRKIKEDSIQLKK
jgi:hypothetical protein